MIKENIIIPTSSGELIDKISILKIKKKKIVNKLNLINFKKELFLLNKIYKKNFKKNKKLIIYEKQLIKINTKLWDIEDRIRFLESRKSFKSEFIKLARSVYINNDERAELKKKIN